MTLVEPAIRAPEAPGGVWRCVLASGNADKLVELRTVLAGLPWELVPQTELGVAPAEETATTFVENAIIKARHAACLTGLPAIADDSGLEVVALKGAPGVHSARYGGLGTSDTENVRKLLDEMQGHSLRAARFRCVAVLVRHPDDPFPVIGAGTWSGEIARAPRGDRGFGYDPVFWLPRHGCTAAELDIATKNRISHRARALRALRAALDHDEGSG